MERNPDQIHRDDKALQSVRLKSLQILVASKPYVDESRRGSDLLLDHPILESLRQPAGEPKPRGCPCLVPQKRTLDLADDTNAKRACTDIVAAESAMSASETSNKVHKPKSYDKAIANPIHRTCLYTEHAGDKQ